LLPFLLLFLFCFFSLLSFIYFSKDGEEIQSNTGEERVDKNKGGKSLSDNVFSICCECMLSLTMVCCCGAGWTKRSNTVAKDGIDGHSASSNRKGKNIIELKVKKNREGGFRTFQE
jgi:hypothetical protein